MIIRNLLKETIKEFQSHSAWEACMTVDIERVIQTHEANYSKKDLKKRNNINDDSSSISDAVRIRFLEGDKEGESFLFTLCRNNQPTRLVFIWV